MALPKIIADFETQLSTAIAVGSTTFSIASATDDDGVALPTGTYYFTIDGASSQKEYISGTLTGTAVTSAVTVSRQGVETSGAARAHRVGATVVLTDFATYKKYMDDLSIAGATDASTTIKGIVEEATQAEVDAGTAIGGTSARLFINPSTHRGRAFNDYAADAGGTDAYAITITPAITAYATGQVFVFKANTANTGAATLNVSGLGAKDIKKNVSNDLSTGDIAANQVVQVIYDGTNMQLQSAVPSATPTVTSFTASGTWTKPSGLSYVIVEVQAGGAAGGGTAGNQSGGAGGGGAGGYSKKRILAASLGATETVTVGAAGTGVSNGTGGSGGNSSFGAHATATGGTGALAAGSSAAGGVGGGAAGGDLNITGQSGMSASNTASSLSGGGGSSMFGFGGASRASDGAGNVAVGYGAGGAGSFGDSSSPNAAGGAGTAGYITVTEYY